MEPMATPSIVFDCGAHHLRAGYGGEHGPRLDVPALVGRPRHRGVAMAAGMDELSVGEDALVRRGLLATSCPVKDGLVDDWEAMEQLWSHVLYKELLVNPEQNIFLTTQTVNAPAAQKERTLEVLMETFHVNALYLGTSQVLSAYAHGLTTALVLDSGKDATMAVPVYEGYALGRYVTRSPLAGDALTTYLGNLLKEEGYSLGTPVERDLVSQAKESVCYVQPRAPAAGVDDMAAADSYGRLPPEAANDRPERLFRLPDGQVLPLSHHCYRTTEVLFNFSLLGDDAKYAPPYKVLTEVCDVFTPSFPKGISWLPFAAISGCDPAIQRQLYASICLAGNNLSFPGLRERLESEIVQLYRENHTSEAVAPINVRDLSDARGYSAWLGCSILSRMSMFNHMVVSRREYEESGASIVHCKQL